MNIETSSDMSRMQDERITSSAYHIPVASSGGSSDYGATTLPALRGPKLRALIRLPSRPPTSKSLSLNELYLEQSGVRFYVDDLVQQLEDKRPEEPAQFIANYFSAVAKGTNIRGRSFEYINGCIQNRAAFLAQLQHRYAKIDQDMLMTVGDFTEMLWCLSADLPQELVNQATCHLSKGEDGQQRASLRTFLEAFSACFLLDDFVNKMYDIYSEVMACKGQSCSPRCTSGRAVNAVAKGRIIVKLQGMDQQNICITAW